MDALGRFSAISTKGLPVCIPVLRAPLLMESTLKEKAFAPEEGDEHS